MTTTDFTLAFLHLQAVKEGYTVFEAPISRTDDPSSQYREGIDLRPSIQRLTSAQQQEALASLNAGIPLRKVAKQFEVNHESLRKFAKREGIGLRPWGQRLTPTEQKLTPEQQEEVLTLLGAGTSLRRVARQFDMSRESLRRLVKELKGER